MTPTEIIFAIAMIFQISGGQVAGTATGFFIMNEEGNKFFITNKHVVQNPKGNVYDELILKVHTDSMDLEKVADLRVPLTSDDGRIPFYQYYEDIDVVAIPLDGIDIGNSYIKYITVENCPPPFLYLEYGTKLNVIGFPRGLTDTKKFYPILKSTAVSTPPFEEFNDKHFFLMDGNLKKGMSGAPVFTELTSTFATKEGRVMASGEEPKLYFLGIHSASLSSQIGKTLEPKYVYVDGKIQIESLTEVPLTENLELHTCYNSSKIFQLIEKKLPIKSER